MPFSTAVHYFHFSKLQPMATISDNAQHIYIRDETIIDNDVITNRLMMLNVYKKERII